MNFSPHIQAPTRDNDGFSHPPIGTEGVSTPHILTQTHNKPKKAIMSVSYRKNIKKIIGYCIQNWL